MLVLTRGVNQAIRIGEDIRIVVTKVGPGNRVKIAIEAPRDVTIRREEKRDKP